MVNKKKIFLSYRRSDAGGHARFLFWYLKHRFDGEHIFFDRSSIESGDVFPPRLQAGVQGCTVLLALIGSDWVDAKGWDGRPRLEDPEDFVRREIALALDGGKKVIPVLFDREMPLAQDLPDPLRRLADCDALMLRGKDYEYETQLEELVRLLAKCPGVPTPRPNPFQDGQFVPVQRAPLREMFKPLFDEYRSRVFGGRQEISTRITEFIRKDTGGYLVITAPAGFGKTALIANVIDEQPKAFAYYFFTLLYGDRCLEEGPFLRCVVQQMAEWHGHTKDLPSEDALNELTALYHKFIDQPLDKTRILILDALDEVTPWKLKPYLSRRLPNDLHIIVTIRDVGQDWPGEYGFPADQISLLPLGGLDREEVADVVRRTGEKGAMFAESDVLLEKIMDIAAYEDNPDLGADPFYVRFLAEDIGAGQINADNIAEQPRGLDGALDDWWKNVKQLAGETPARDLFGTLAAALGRLSRADLERANPSLRDDWAGDFFDEVIAKVRRMVFGGPEQGYALLHPRLRRYMANPKRIGNIDAYRRRLRDYCANWQDHGSAYALAHYPYHLKEAGEDEQLRALLLDYDWIQAKLNSTNFQSLLADYGLVTDDSEVDLVKGALDLSRRTPFIDSNLLPGQLIGRLRRFDRETGVQALVEKALHGPGKVWLCPLTPSLIHQTTSLLDDYPNVPPSSVFNTLTLTVDGKIISLNSGAVEVREVKSGKSRLLKKQLHGRDRGQRSLIFADGRQVTLFDGMMQVRDGPTGEGRVFGGSNVGCRANQIRDMHRGRVNEILQLTDRRVVSCGFDKSVRVWDVDTWTQVALFFGDSSISDVTAYGNNLIVAWEQKPAVHILELRD